MLISTPSLERVSSKTATIVLQQNFIYLFLLTSTVVSLSSHLYSLEVSADEREGRCRHGDPHPDWGYQGVGRLAQLLHSDVDQRLEHSPTLHERLRNAHSSPGYEQKFVVCNVCNYGKSYSNSNKTSQILLPVLFFSHATKWLIYIVTCIRLVTQFMQNSTFHPYFRYGLLS